MKRNSMNKSLSVVLCVVLIAAMALLSVGCGAEPETPATVRTFTFQVVAPDGTENRYTVETDADTVGAALIAKGLIEGEEGPYGLYVKTVDGITLDYETDGMYWAFYVDGEYGITGVELTDITDGAVYTFKAE